MPPLSAKPPPPRTSVPTYFPKAGRHTEERAMTTRASTHHHHRSGVPTSFAPASTHSGPFGFVPEDRGIGPTYTAEPNRGSGDFGVTQSENFAATMNSFSTGITRDPSPPRADCSYLFDSAGHGMLPKKVAGMRVLDLSQEDVKASRQAMRDVVGTLVNPEGLGLIVNGQLRPTSIPDEFHVSHSGGGTGRESPRKGKNSKITGQIYPMAMPMGRVDTLKLWESFRAMIKHKKAKNGGHIHMDDAREVADLVMQELARQVYVHCAERGMLLEYLRLQVNEHTNRLQKNLVVEQSQNVTLQAELEDAERVINEGPDARLRAKSPGAIGARKEGAILKKKSIKSLPKELQTLDANDSWGGIYGKDKSTELAETKRELEKAEMSLERANTANRELELEMERLQSTLLQNKNTHKPEGENLETAADIELFRSESQQKSISILKLEQELRDLSETLVKTEKEAKQNIGDVEMDAKEREEELLMQVKSLEEELERLHPGGNSLGATHESLILLERRESHVSLTLSEKAAAELYKVDEESISRPTSKHEQKAQTPPSPKARKNKRGKTPISASNQPEAFGIVSNREGTPENDSNLRTESAGSSVGNFDTTDRYYAKDLIHRLREQKLVNQKLLEKEKELRVEIEFQSTLDTNNNMEIARLMDLVDQIGGASGPNTNINEIFADFASNHIKYREEALRAKNETPEVLKLRERIQELVIKNQLLSSNAEEKIAELQIVIDVDKTKISELNDENKALIITCNVLRGKVKRFVHAGLKEKLSYDATAREEEKQQLQLENEIERGQCKWCDMCKGYLEEVCSVYKDHTQTKRPKLKGLKEEITDYASHLENQIHAVSILQKNWRVRMTQPDFQRRKLKSRATTKTEATVSIKNIRWTKAIILGIYQHKLKMDAKCEKEKVAKRPLVEAFYEYTNLLWTEKGEYSQSYTAFVMAVLHYRTLDKDVRALNDFLVGTWDSNIVDTYLLVMKLQGEHKYKAPRQRVVPESDWFAIIHQALGKLSPTLIKECGKALEAGWETSGRMEDPRDMTTRLIPSDQFRTLVCSLHTKFDNYFGFFLAKLFTKCASGGTLRDTFDNFDFLRMLGQFREDLTSDDIAYELWERATVCTLNAGALYGNTVSWQGVVSLMELELPRKIDLKRIFRFRYDDLKDMVSRQKTDLDNYKHCRTKHYKLVQYPKPQDRDDKAAEALRSSQLKKNETLLVLFK